MQQNDPDARRLPELRLLYGSSSRFARPRQIVDANDDKRAPLENVFLETRSRSVARRRLGATIERVGRLRFVIIKGERNGSPFLNRRRL